MFEPTDDISRLLEPWSSRGLFENAIRLQPGVEPARALAKIIRGLEAIAERYSGAVQLNVEPTGDSCETGNWVEIACYCGTVWADMTPRPQRFGGTIPRQIDAELELAGWVVVGEQPDVPEYLSPGEEEVHSGSFPGEGPMRRLVAGTDHMEVEEWCDLVAHGVARVIHPTAQQWYLHASISVAVVDDDLEVRDEAIAAGEWNINIGAFLDPSEWRRAIWRPDTEGGAMTCDLGLHHLHEPPCPAAAPWMES